MNNKIETDKAAGKLLNIFEEMDQHTDGGGELPVDIVVTKFQENMQLESILEDDLRRVISQMDKKGDGYVQYKEFVEEAHKNLHIDIRNLP